MTRLTALFALGLSAVVVSSIPIEPSFAPTDVALPSPEVELIPAASMEPLAFVSQTTANAAGTPEPLLPFTPEPLPVDIPMVSPAVDTPTVTTPPDSISAVTPEPVLVNNTANEPFTFNVEGSIAPTPESGIVGNKGTVSEQAVGTAVTPQPGTQPINEGCVAIEHLKGYVLQHPQHLSRRVLCADGFCATPNHAIIVDGSYTSMKQLCADEWSCVESVKLVNNLKISANRRAVINDHITVTPYDVRFPKIASWTVQVLEDVFNLVAASLLAAVVSVVMLVVNGRSNRSKVHQLR